jgi:hypothetical protein
MEATKPTFEEAMQAYRNTEDLIKPFLRRLAARRLVNAGAEEVGTSDINHELYHMFSEYGSFQECYEENILEDSVL